MHARTPFAVVSPDPLPTTSPTGTVPPTTTPLTDIDALSLASVTPILVLLLAGIVIAGGLLVVYSRSVASAQPSVVRSWIAVSLVLGLLVFTALAFTLRDVSLRSAILGAFTTSVGSVIAFFFSSRANEKASQDRVQELQALLALADEQRAALASVQARSTGGGG